MGIIQLVALVALFAAWLVSRYDNLSLDLIYAFLLVFGGAEIAVAALVFYRWINNK